VVVARVSDPSLKVIVPVAVLGETEAVSVVVCPTAEGLADDVSATVDGEPTNTGKGTMAPAALMAAGRGTVSTMAGVKEAVLVGAITTGYEPGANPAGMVRKADAKPKELPGSMKIPFRAAGELFTVAVKDALGTATGDKGARAPLTMGGVVAPTPVRWTVTPVPAEALVLFVFAAPSGLRMEKIPGAVAAMEREKVFEATPAFVTTTCTVPLTP